MKNSKKFTTVLSSLLLVLLLIFSNCTAEIAPDAQFMDFEDLPVVEEENNVCYIVLDFDRNIDVYKDDMLNEKLCTINKEGASILYFNSNANLVYHVWFIDQDGNTVDGYIDFMGVELNSLTDAEAAGMVSFGAEPRDVGGIHVNLFYTNVLYPSQMPTEVPVTEEPVVVTPVPVQEIKIPVTSQKEEATEQAQPQKKANPTKGPSTKNNGEVQTKEPLPDELVFATEEETESPDKDKTADVQNEQKNEQKSEVPEPTKASMTVTDEELALLGATESSNNQLLDTVIDFVKTNYLYIAIGAGALLLFIIIAVIVKKKKHRTPKSSLLDR